MGCKSNASATNLQIFVEKNFLVFVVYGVKHQQHVWQLVVVADHFQHRGAGRRILLALARLAYGEGIREWTAEVLGQNRPMLALLKGLGLPLTLVTGREMVFARLDLAPMASFVLPSA